SRRCIKRWERAVPFQAEPHLDGASETVPPSAVAPPCAATSISPTGPTPLLERVRTQCRLPAGLRRPRPSMATGLSCHEGDTGRKRGHSAATTEQVWRARRRRNGSRNAGGSRHELAEGRDCL